jgi:GNAT superfamily N-acetyltransferase
MASINKLESNDLNGLKHLYEDAFEGSLTDINKMIDTYNKIKDDPQYIILCAKTDGIVVGSVLGIFCSELFGQCNPFMVLEDVAVLKNYRRQGIAKQLLQSIESYAKTMNCSMILFVSSEHRTGAHQLYESLGYGLDKVNGYRKRLN